MRANARVERGDRRARYAREMREGEREGETGADVGGHAAPEGVEHFEVRDVAEYRRGKVDWVGCEEGADVDREAAEALEAIANE